MEVDVADLRVLPLGYRWGSCTAEGKLNIHWATMQLPDFATRRTRLREVGPSLWLPY
jgi:predicted metal-dependent hydrolase